GFVRHVDLFGMWICSACGFVRHVDLFGMWICSACGFVRHVDLAESQQVSFQQSKLKFRLFFREVEIHAEV
ncbi:MAG: hypothetical protein WC656_11230, partial [Sulfurimonas sp.]